MSVKWYFDGKWTLVRETRTPRHLETIGIAWYQPSNWLYLLGERFDSIRFAFERVGL